MKTKEELAKLITGRDYREEVSVYEDEQARLNGLIIISGQSDDIIRFWGAISDEIDAYDGTDFIIATPGTEIIVDEDDETYQKEKTLTPVRLNRRQVNEKNFFQALWSPEELECSWLIKTDLPHVSFDIMEDGELYCRGIIIEAAALS